MKHMKFSPRTSLWALAVLVTPALQAQEPVANTGMYVGIGAGESKAYIDNARIAQDLLGPGFTNDAMTVDRKGNSYKAYLGFPINPNWAIEAGYFDLGRLGFGASTTPAGSLSGAARIKGLNLDLVASLPITDRWSLLGRVGAAYGQTKSDFSSTGAVTVAQPSTTKRETNYKFGVGTEYAFTPELTGRLEGERYRVNDAGGHRANVDLISLGLVFRFGGPTPAIKTAYTPYVAPVAQAVYAPPVAVAQAPAPAPAPVVTPVVPPTPVAKPLMKVKLQADSLFGFDQDTMQSDGKQALDKLLMELKDVNVEMIQVTGHTDRLGAKAYNDKLSTRRAEAVRNYLVQVGGIPANKVTATGVGSDLPDAQTSDCKGMKSSQALITCLRVDRRVDVDVLGSQQQR
jgi:OOP family OmpA-OmpF porin